VHERCV